MRLKTPITKDQLKNHWTYNGWKYLLAIVLAVLGWNLVYSVTSYRPPEEKRIDVYIQTASATSDSMDAFLEPLWKQAAPDMELVSAVALLPADQMAEMQLSTYIMAGAGDIYFLYGKYFKNWASSGAFLPLEEWVETGRLRVGDLDVSAGRVAVITAYDEQERPVSSETHLYGIPLDAFPEFLRGMQVDTRGMFAVVAANNHNDEHVIPFLDALLQAGRGGADPAENE